MPAEELNALLEGSGGLGKEVDKGYVGLSSGVEGLFTYLLISLDPPREP